MSDMLDCLGVPEYFATTTRLEDAGGGNIRIFNCIKRNGVLIPSCTVIFPTASVLKIVQATHDFARKISGLQIEGETAH